MKRLAPALTVLALAFAPASLAEADVDDWTAVPEFTSSPEHFGFELRVGVYNLTGLGADFGSADYFGGDVGPYLSLQFHYFPFRIDYLGMVGFGASLGWSQWETSSPGGTEGDRNVFEVLAMQPMLVWRIDTLARYVDVPIVLTPKIGFDFTRWLTAPGIGTNTQTEGWSMGPRFSGKVSLELDFLEPRAARQLDEEWGINHSEILFELWYSMAGEIIGGQLPVNGWGWTLGLGLTF